MGFFHHACTRMILPAVGIEGVLSTRFLMGELGTFPKNFSLFPGGK